MVAGACLLAPLEPAKKKERKKSQAQARIAGNGPLLHKHVREQSPSASSAAQPLLHFLVFTPLSVDFRAQPSCYQIQSARLAT